MNAEKEETLADMFVRLGYKDAVALYEAVRTKIESHQRTVEAAPGKEPVATSSITEYETDHFACAAGLLRFSKAMSAKLAKKRNAGCGSWNKPSECSLESLYQLLEEHERKGDHVDVANLRMMIWNRENPNG